jgi:ATP-dependent Clp endopeptidase proteolytic subunit ClpP
LRIVNKTPEEATVYLYDEVGWFGVEAESFIKDLNAIDAETINIRFNSPGGSVFDGTAIHNAIKQHKSRTVAHIDGLAASISSVIALAADEVRMSDNAFLMIHEPWSIVIGNADMMREEADLLDKVGGTIAKTYTNKTGKENEEIAALMAAETWMTADEALEMGFIDAIDTDEQDEKAKATLFDLSVFANVPDELKEAKPEPTPRDLERALRDAGCSAKHAKKILADGLRDSVRDEPPADDPPPVEPQRDVEPETPKKKDRTADLLTRAEMVAPTIH